jgi:hypothetical protein
MPCGACGKPKAKPKTKNEQKPIYTESEIAVEGKVYVVKPN